MRLPVRQHSPPALLLHHWRKRVESAFPLVATTLSIPYQFAVGKASRRDQRVPHPFGVVASAIPDRLAQGLDRNQRLLGTIAPLAHDPRPLQLPVAVAYLQCTAAFHTVH